MLYLSHADTQRLDIRMTDVVPAIEEAFRRVGNGQAVVAPRVRVLHPPLEKNSTGKGRPWVRDLRIILGAVEEIGYGVRLGTSLRRQAGGVILVLFDWQTMELSALISDHLVHAVRSTAPCGVMAKYRAGKCVDAGAHRLRPLGTLGGRSRLRSAADPGLACLESDAGASSRMCRILAKPSWRFDSSSRS
jgi:ornithine cyclodeaminase/alanine dehydrogenase-like protein (mu-crystallin family)